ncbi:MAG: hypothetical protein ABIK65_14410 [Candidatus Eisenbacteria bacterium]
MSEEKIRTDDGMNGTVYERIVVAAREARRLNTIRLRGGMVDTEKKVTNEALRRAAEGKVDWEVAAPEARRAAPGRASGAADEESPVDDSR